MAQDELKDAKKKLQELRCLLTTMNGTPTGRACPFCNQAYARHFGFTHGRKQRLRCGACGRTFVEGRKPAWYRGIDLSVHFRKTHDRIKYAIDLLIGGASQRETCRKAKIQKWTAHHITQELRAIGMMPTFCSCGGPAGHKGWCKDRFVRSERRQAALAKLHERQRSKLL